MGSILDRMFILGDNVKNSPATCSQDEDVDTVLILLNLHMFVLMWSVKIEKILRQTELVTFSVPFPH